MDNFIVSALKYRPTTFRSVVGQHSLTTTLKNAIQSNHLSHAYLFCGPRGVGKTTCARIFAKTINCQNLTSEHEACNTCESCVSFNQQRSYNIHELDAASNNGVDDIRSLIDQVRIPPQIGRYSVYIIDEVHMLSQGAFNAFLKTLEEPPAHAVFILATTEKHKIIPTILSRCQIYDFNRITIQDTVQHLQYVAQQEGVKVDINGLNIVAQKSDGGMRDALSIFDQLVSFCGNEITYQGVIENLNVLDYEYYFKLVEYFLQGDVSNSLLIFNEILNKGFDAHHFVSGLSTHLRDLLVSKDPQTIVLLEVGADIGAKFREQSLKCSPDFLFQALKINNDCDLSYRSSNNKRLLVELSLIRLCQLSIRLQSDEKKNNILTDEAPPALLKIIPSNNPDQSGNQSPKSTGTPASQNTSIQSGHTTQSGSQIQNTKQDLIARPGQPAQTNFSAQTAQTGLPKSDNTSKLPFKRPVSVSITNQTSNKTRGESNDNTPISYTNQRVQESRSFKYDDLVSVWKSYIAEIPEIVAVTSYIQNNTPGRITDLQYELKVSNVMQSNELRRLMPQMMEFIRAKLSNHQINFVIKIVEESELPRTQNPEEMLKKMMEENQALKYLKNSLNLEID